MVAPIHPNQLYLKTETLWLESFVKQPNAINDGVVTKDEISQYLDLNKNGHVEAAEMRQTQNALRGSGLWGTFQSALANQGFPFESFNNYHYDHKTPPTTDADSLLPQNLPTALSEDDAPDMSRADWIKLLTRDPKLFDQLSDKTKLLPALLVALENPALAPLKEKVFNQGLQSYAQSSDDILLLAYL